jgi:tripartite-type tricarboxylate transporter receptor subunit TctC
VPPASKSEIKSIGWTALLLHTRERASWDDEIPRRRFLQLAAGAFALQTFSRTAAALDYPTRQVRVVAGFAAGGNVDMAARLIGQWLSERLGQPFVVENRPGAGSNLAAEVVVKATPDGYTLLLVSIANAINETLYKSNFALIRDIVPIAGLYREPYVLLVHPSVPAKTVPELIAYSRINPGKLNMATGGIGSLSHMSGELFKMMAGIDMVYVVYRGAGPALTDLLGGQVQVYFSGMSAAIEHIRAGKVRVLAVTTATRSETFPDVPTVGDFLLGYEASAWYGIGAPKNTPNEIIDKLNKETNAALINPKMKARLADFGGLAIAGSPAEFGELIVDETEKWGKVIRATNVKPE